MESNPFVNSAKDSYCTIYIVRHGQTDWNVSKKIQGRTNNPLNEKGLKQAKEIAEELKDIRFEAIFSSNLLRARQTAEIIALEKKLAVVTKDALEEKNYGELEGQPQEIIVELFKKFEKMSIDEIFKYRSAPSAETDEEVIWRYITKLRELAIGFKGKTILVVSHHAIMRLLLVHLGFASYTQILPGSIKNTGVLKILTDGVDFFLEDTKGIEIKKKCYGN